MVVDLGNVVIERLCTLVGVEPRYGPCPKTSNWCLWGTHQRAWSEPVTADRGYAASTLHLRTQVFEGFTGSLAQSVALSARLSLPTIAGIAQSTDAPARLELVSSLDVHRGNASRIPDVLAVVARVQAAEARMLSESKGLDWVGLTPKVSTGVNLPFDLLLKPAEMLLSRVGPERRDFGWPEAEVSAAIDELVLRARAEVVIRTFESMSATLLLDSVKGTRSILEVRADVSHPLLGQGLSMVLSTPAASGPLNAMVANALEVRPGGAGDTLGGWWATHGGGLRYAGFYPNAFYHKGFALQLLLGYARRARKTASI